MKNHFLGLTLFSFIVGVSVFAYAIFNVPQIINVPAPAYKAKPYSCKTKKSGAYETKGNFPLVKQAVLDMKTKQLNWEITVPNPDAWIKLHFFVKDANGTRHLNSVSAPRAAYENGPATITSSYDWLDNLSSYENLYVIAEDTKTGELKDKNFRPQFQPDKAASVLLYYGEQSYLTEKYFQDAR